MEDSQIIELYWQRSENAIAETSKKYGKLCRHIAMNIVGNFSDAMNEMFVGYSIYPDRDTSPGHYVLLVETTKPHTPADEKFYSEKFEEFLCNGNVSVGPLIKSGALEHCEVKFLRHGTYDDYRQMLKENGANLNQIKPVKVINSEDRKNFFFSHIIED